MAQSSWKGAATAEKSASINFSPASDRFFRFKVISNIACVCEHFIHCKSIKRRWLCVGECALVEWDIIKFNIEDMNERAHSSSSAALPLSRMAINQVLTQQNWNELKRSFLLFIAQFSSLCANINSCALFFCSLCRGVESNAKDKHEGDVKNGNTIKLNSVNLVLTIGKTIDN